MFGDVVGANIVGYNVKSDISLVKDANNRAFTLVGLPFKTMKANGNWSLNDINFNALKSASLPKNADQVWLWVDVGDGVYDYQQYFYRNATDGWKNMNGGALFDADHPDGVPAGTAFWFGALNPAAAITMTTDGEVSNADREVTILRGQFQFVSSPFPVNLKLNDTTCFDSSNCKGAALPKNADQIWFWVDKGDGTWDYQQYFYRNATDGWKNMNGGAKFDVDYPNGAPVGSGFWFKSMTGGENYTITFKTPIVK